ncbi:MAG: metal ABC transporter permease [Halothece sp. Uz-M2-17]|nr:metal ABC transporter permease [Halothece sp. Uz-M2-17]
MLEALQYEFFRNAIIAGILVSIAGGIIGSLVVVNRIVFVAGGIAHAAYGGVGLGFFLGFNPVLGALGFSLGSALLMGAVQRNKHLRRDTAIGMLWAIGMAIGVIFTDLTPGYKAELESYLFGSILAVPSANLWIMLVIDIIIITLVYLFYKELLAISFDETFATVRNIPVNQIYLLLMGIIALAVAMMMQVVGLILVIALLAMPAAVTSQFVKDLKTMMILGIVLSLLFVIIGLGLSYTLNLTSGATIILVSAIAYLITLIFKSMLKWRKN